MTYRPAHRQPRPAVRPAARVSALTGVVVFAFLALGIGAAMAFFSLNDSSNPGGAAADTMQQGSTPSVTATGASVTVSWPVAKTAGGATDNGYTITRYNASTGGTATPASGGCSGTITALTCTETGVPAGNWWYTVTPHLFLWTGAESVRSPISVDQAPAITTAPGVTFTVGSFGTFTVSTTGFPAPSLNDGSATLPSPVTFHDDGNGTATLSGTPASGTGGTYTFTITASNGVGSPARQVFTLTVDQAPAITSAPGVTFTVGTAGSFTVSTTAFPTAALSDGGAALPGGVSFVDNHNGTATLAGSPATTGTFSVTITASNGVSPNATQSFTLTVTPPATATHLLLTVATTTPTAGSADNVTITALDASNNVVTSYGGTKGLTFGGASLSPSGVAPTVTNTSGTAINFGSITSITFTNGIATVSSGKNGVMTLFKSETATITVTDGSINNGVGVTVIVKAASPSGLAVSNSNNPLACGSISGNYACTASPGLGNSGSLTADVSFVDSYGNLTIESTTTDSAIALSNPAKGSVAPNSLTIPKGTTTSSTTFTLTKTGSNTATTTISFGTTFTLTLATN